MRHDKPLRNKRKRVLSLLTLLEFRPADLTACIAPTSWLSSVCLDCQITQRVIFSLARLCVRWNFSRSTVQRKRVYFHTNAIISSFTRVFSRQRISPITIRSRNRYSLSLLEWNRAVSRKMERSEELTKRRLFEIPSWSNGEECLNTIILSVRTCVRVCLLACLLLYA